jgi:hypothetical protein
MILSPCGKRRVCFIGVAAKGCHCNLVVTSAFIRGHDCRWLRDSCGWRVLAVARHLESSKVLRVVFGYVSFRVKTRTLGQRGRDLSIVNRHTKQLLYDASLPANHSDPDLTARILAFCATRGTTCGYTKSYLTFAAPCFITRTPSQCTA